MRDSLSEHTDYSQAEGGYDTTHGASWRVARQPRGMEAGTRKLVMIAAGLGGALIVAIGLYSTTGHRSTVVPVIQADSRPIRVKPENRGGMQINADDEEVMGDAAASASKLAPAAEAPAPKMLRARQDAPLAPPPAATPAKEIVTAAPNVPVAEKPVAAKPAILPQAATPAATQHAGMGKTLVQIAALGSEEAARAEWQRLSRTLPDLFGNRQPAVSKIERDGHVLWRLRTGGFSDIAQATAFCERVRAKRSGCSVASL